MMESVSGPGPRPTPPAEQLPSSSEQLRAARCTGVRDIMTHRQPPHTSGGLNVTGPRGREEDGPRGYKSRGYFL